MTMTQTVGKIYSYPDNCRVNKALIAAAYNDVKVELVPGFEMGVTNKTKEFLEKFPLGKVPAMETADGPLTESDAIAFYVANSVKDTQLLGKTNYEKALVQKYVAFAGSELAASVGKWYYPLLGYYTYSKETEQQAKDTLKRALVALNTELLSKTFLVGERVTMADISCACHLMDGYRHLFDASYRAAFPNVTRWFLTVVNQPKVKAVVGEVVLCTKTMAYDAKKAQPAKKEEKKAKKEEKPKAENLEDIAEAEAKAEAKKKNPLDELPPSPFVLDAWKRFYSNNAEADSIKYFWDNFDPEGYSLWKVDYRYNDELGAIFMSSNLIGGFFQRLDRARKYAFGSMCVVGEANDNTIDGYFVLRGQDVMFEITDAADYESYKFTKVDPKSEAVRKDFNHYLAWDMPKFQDGKIFK